MNRLKIKSVAVDYDNTLIFSNPDLYPYYEPKDVNRQAFSVLKEYKKRGGIIILFTCRTDEHLQIAIDACKKYLPTISCELDNPKCEILVEDAIEYIKDKENMFDIVLIDSTDPMGPGEGLFTDEFYTNVKRSLKEGRAVALTDEELSLM